MGRLFIIHYHLNPGGVTRIIESQVQAIRKTMPELDVFVLAGECTNREIYNKTGVRLMLNPELNYLSSESDAQKTYHSLLKFFQELFNPTDIIHFHNLNLGKNPALTCVMSHFAEKGYSLVNHAHDFAEDRPENFTFMKKIIAGLTGKESKEIMYPDLQNMFHAVLNSHDLKRLSTYGIDEHRSMLLPNPVVFSSSFDTSELQRIRKEICTSLNISTEKKIMTYPVRVIRRKNIGEYILFCWLFRDKASWIVTQPPKNPIEIVPYEQWKEFCRSEEIPLIFEAGTKLDFEGLLRASDFCFTTSLKEGFGMVYMEPWLMDTPVIGRDLVNITRDLEQSGMVFPLLYSSLDILHQGSRVDFGSLPMQEQMEYIHALIRDEQKEKELFVYNPFLNKLLNSVNDKLITKNKNTILQEYSLDNYGQRLKSIYQKTTG